MRTAFVLPHNPISMIAFIVFLSRGVRMVLYKGYRGVARPSVGLCTAVCCYW